MKVVASLSQDRTAAAQCGLFTHKSVPVIFEPPCTSVVFNCAECIFGINLNALIHYCFTEAPNSKFRQQKFISSKPTGKCADIISADGVIGIKMKDRVFCCNWYSSNCDKCK